MSDWDKGSAWDGMTVDVRRANWGWWGDPWPSGVCENDDRSINWGMQREFPTGETCFWCKEDIVEGQNGSSMPSMGRDEKGEHTVTIIFQHKECSLRQVLGSYKHLTGNCPGDGSCHDEPADDMTLREDALAVWEWTRVHGHAV